MKLRKYQPSRLRQPLQWVQWSLLGRMPRPSKLQKTRPKPGPIRSIFLRHLDCGSCNGCELALQALHNPFYDLPGRGIHFVASPRHADALILTGPLTHNMMEAALATLEQMSAPRIIAVGDCAIDGGPFQDAYGVVPVDERPPTLTDPIIKQIAGCPPSPEELLQDFADITLEVNSANHASPATIERGGQ